MPKTNKKPIKQQKDDFLKAYLKNLGITTIACKEAGIGWHKFQDWFKDDPVFRKSCLEIEQVQGDWVENKLLQKIEEGDATCIIFYLKAKRGWRDRQVLQIEGQVDHNVRQVQIIVNSDHTKELMDNSVKLINLNEDNQSL